VYRRSTYSIAMRPSKTSSFHDLERHYANDFQSSKGDQWHERNIVSASQDVLRILLEMQPCFLFRMRLAAVVQLAKRDVESGLFVGAAARELLANEHPGECPSLDGAQISWAGITERMTRRAWLQRVLEVLGGTNVSAQAAVPGSQGSAEGAQEPSAQTSGRPSSPTAASDFYLPDIRPGQFQLPHLVTGSGLVRIGVRNNARQQFGAESPLHVLHFSGQTYGDTTVSYVGEELRTGDIEVWGQLLKLAAPLSLGSRLTVSARDLLTALGRGTGGPAYAAVRAEIARLQGARLRIRSSHEPMREQFRAMFPDDPLSKSDSRGAIEVSLQLLGSSTTDGRMWSVAVPREVRVAFGPRLSSWFSEKEYGLLSKRREGDTVKRLYLLYRSHAKPWPFTVQELRRFLGSTMGRDSDLKAALNAAHDRLTHANLIKAWRYGASARRPNCADRVYEVDF
jgi:hypothetical protein